MARKSYIMTEEHRRAIKEGIKKSREQGLSKSRKGIKRPPRSEEWSRKISEAKKGKSSWNKNLEHTEEHKINLSKSLTGRKLTKEHKDNIGKGLLAEKNYQWIGGCAEYWAKEMKKIYKECILCKSSCYLEMHHIDGNNKNNDRSNRRILCKKCHKFWHYN